MSAFVDKVGVVLKALPTWGAAAVGALTWLATEVVPKLPGEWPVKAGAALAVVLGALTAVVAVVSRVTPVLYPEDVGLLPNQLEEVPDLLAEDAGEPGDDV